MRGERASPGGCTPWPCTMDERGLEWACSLTQQANKSQGHQRLQQATPLRHPTTQCDVHRTYACSSTISPSIGALLFGLRQSLDRERRARYLTRRKRLDQHRRARVIFVCLIRLARVRGALEKSARAGHRRKRPSRGQPPLPQCHAAGPSHRCTDTYWQTKRLV